MYSREEQVDRMSDKRKAIAQIIIKLPSLQKRHSKRIFERKLRGGDTGCMIKELFDDINELRSLLVDAQASSLAALKMFILYLDYLQCNADAWKLRVLTKHKFPKAAIDINEQDLVVHNNLELHHHTINYNHC